MMLNTNRRVWLKQMITIGGAMLLLPGCVGDENVKALKLVNIHINDSDESFLAEIGEAIIPQDKTKGSKDLNLHHFVLKMMDDCYGQEDQELFVQGLKNMPAYLKKQTGLPFLEQNLKIRSKALTDITKNNATPVEIAFFLAETKKWVVKGFQTSEYVLTTLLPYEMIPGRFNGCVKIINAAS